VAAALAVAAALDVPLLAAAAGLERTALPPHRSRMVAAGGRMVLDDCYNANPASMSAALATVIQSVGTSGRAFAVLGDMLELGPEAAELHAALGAEAARAGVAGLAAVGEFADELARGARAAGLARVVVTRDPAAAAAAVAGWSAGGDWILVKASRGIRLERTVEALQSILSPEAGKRAG
jgi:UDP-N-acetylmuramyl pentapeptide synthase